MQQRQKTGLQILTLLSTFITIHSTSQCRTLLTQEFNLGTEMWSTAIHVHKICTSNQ